MLDLIIIGAGPAGITASVYAARKKLDLLVITRDIGGQAALSGDVENYTGYQFITGPELADKFEEHMRRFDIRLKEGEGVTGIKNIKGGFSVETSNGSYEARAVIIASGKSTKKLNIPGEDEYKNKGLTYCATCDGPLFAKKDVAVIGGGNSAVDAALQLVKIASHVYVINLEPALRADALMVDALNRAGNVTVMNSTSVTQILGDKFVRSIKIKKASGEDALEVQGVFVEIGLIPNSGFANGVDKNGLGEIKVNSSNETSVPGIFAAGDVTDVPEKQIIIAAGEGSKAALAAFRYLVQHN